jgi:hypothetical protein
VRQALGRFPPQPRPLARRQRTALRASACSSSRCCVAFTSTSPSPRQVAIVVALEKPRPSRVVHQYLELSSRVLFRLIRTRRCGLVPTQASAHAAISDERPIPARQWTATAFPSLIRSANNRARAAASPNDPGTPRSGIGKEINSITCTSQRWASLCRPSSLTSSGSRRLTTMSIPSIRQPETSSSSQSPARGRAMIAKRPAAGVSIQ